MAIRLPILSGMGWNDYYYIVGNVLCGLYVSLPVSLILPLSPGFLLTFNSP